MILKQEPLANGVWLVIVGGRLDQDTTTDFETQVLDAIGIGRTHLLIDLSEVSFVNSGGLRSLVTIWRKAKEKGGDVALVNLNDKIDQVFSMVGFDKVFSIFNDIKSAEAYFAQSPDSAFGNSGVQDEGFD